MHGRTLILTLAMVLVGTGGALAQRFELAVEKDHALGASRGTLAFEADGVVYDTTDADDARRWSYDDVKQVQILSPTRVTIETFEDQGWLKLGADRAFEFELTQGTVPADLVAFLWRRLRQPMVTAISPEAPSPPLGSVPVKLRARLSGSQGTLDLHEDRLVYRTDRLEDGRAWRPIDVELVYQPSRHRLDIDAYEGGGDRTRTFSFDLKEPLPPGFLDLVWRWLHAPSPARTPPRAAP